MDLELESGYGGRSSDVAVASPAQAVALVGAPAFPNSVKWSEENLLAVASGHLVTILNPASLAGPRGFVSISQSPVLDIGNVTREELAAPALMPFRLWRESRVGVRSVDWSPQGLASNGGCLLAVCTTDSRVKLYRSPFCDYRSEWVEVADLTELMYGYCVENRFKDGELAASVLATENEDSSAKISLGVKTKKRRLSTQEPQHRKVQKTKNNADTHEGANEIVDGATLEEKVSCENPSESLLAQVTEHPCIVTEEATLEVNVTQEPVIEPTLFNLSNGAFQSAVRPLRRRKRTTDSSVGAQDGGTALENNSTVGNLQISRNISAAEYAARSYMLAPLVLAWSAKCQTAGPTGSEMAQSFVLCAVGTKAGSVALFRMAVPQSYSIEKALPLPEICFLGFLWAHESWVTSVCWASCPTSNVELLNGEGGSGETILLATASADGSVKLWSGNSQELALLTPGSHTLPLTLLRQVADADLVPVSSVALTVSEGVPTRVLLAVGKGSGKIAAWEFDMSWCCCQMASHVRAHDQVVTGLIWTHDGRCLYSCGQDNMLKSWELLGNELWPLSFPECSALLVSDPISSELPASALDPFYGVALSRGSLALAVVRGIASDVIDQMYQSRSQKGVVQLFWVGGQRYRDSVGWMTHGGIGRPVAKSLSSEDLDCWCSRLISTFRHLEESTHALVLWDVVTALSYLKTIAGSTFVTSVVSGWLDNWCKEGSHLLGDSINWSVESLQACLPEATCRRLQMINVVYRRVLLDNCKAEVLSGRSSRSNGDSATDRAAHVAGHQWRLSGEGGLTPSSVALPEQQEIWKEHLWLVEHELRQRLMYFTLFAAACHGINLEESEQREEKLGERALPGTWLMADWILANGSQIFPRLVQVATRVRDLSDEILALSGETRSLEGCTFCDASLPLESPEVGYCSSVDFNKEGLNHKHQRCSVSLQVCRPNPLWYCSCCARRATKLAPTFFFTLSSQSDVERLPLPLLLHGVPLPACPFCGILMHRLLPEFLLTPSLT